MLLTIHVFGSREVVENSPRFGFGGAIIHPLTLATLGRAASSQSTRLSRRVLPASFITEPQQC